MKLETNHSLMWNTGNPFSPPREFRVLRLWFKLTDGTYIMLISPTSHVSSRSSNIFSCACSNVQGVLGGSVAIRPIRESGGHVVSSLLINLCNIQLNALLFDAYRSKLAERAMISSMSGFSDMCECSLEY